MRQGSVICYRFLNVKNSNNYFALGLRLHQKQRSILLSSTVVLLSRATLEVLRRARDIFWVPIEHKCVRTEKNIVSSRKTCLCITGDKINNIGQISRIKKQYTTLGRKSREMRVHVMRDVSTFKSDACSLSLGIGLKTWGNTQHARTKHDRRSQHKK